MPAVHRAYQHSLAHTLLEIIPSIYVEVINHARDLCLLQHHLRHTYRIRAQAKLLSPWQAMATLPLHKTALSMSQKLINGFHRGTLSYNTLCGYHPHPSKSYDILVIYMKTYLLPALFVVLLATAIVTQAQFTPPTTKPNCNPVNPYDPDCGVPPPINVGPQAQTKKGPLTIEGAYYIELRQRLHLLK
jgi:hypothetical protein